MRLLFLYTVFLSLCLSGYTCAQDLEATTNDGREVILKSNGTWQFVKTDSAAAVTKRAQYKKDQRATKAFKTKDGAFEIWYNPALWTQDSLQTRIKTSFTHRESVINATVVNERLEMSMESLKEAAIINGRKVAPDFHTIFEEIRTVNGKKVLCLKMQGAAHGIKFTFYGYFYSGKKGTIQVLTYTYDNVFPLFEKDLTDFLNGLIIK